MLMKQSKMQFQATTSITTDDMKLRILRITTIFNIISLAVCILLSIAVAGLIIIVIKRNSHVSGAWLFFFALY